MSEPFIKDAAQAVALLEAVKAAGGQDKYSKTNNIPLSTLRHRIRTARTFLKNEGMNSEPDKEIAEAFTLPNFPDEDFPFEQILTDQLIPNTQKKIKYKKAQEWFSVKINSPGPFMYVAIGDQHIDDPYCNLELFYEHIKICRSHPNIYVLPMGDLHNNWVGKLERLYAEQTVSRDRAYAGIKWFLKESGLKIPVAILGNHDVWNEGKRILKEIVGDAFVVCDWSAKFKLICPNGREVCFDAAHDHKGHSIYNTMHAQKRQALFTGRKAHVFIGAHRHEPGFTKDWWGHERITTWYIRPGSYKWFDQHAVNHGFANHQDAPAMAMIIDPDAKGSNPIVFVSDDLELAVKVLETLRK